MTAPSSRLPRFVDLTLDLDDPDDEAALRDKLAASVGSEARDRYVLRRRTLDARAGRIRYHFRFELVDGRMPESLGGALPKDVTLPPRVIIVGEGPAGLFCAYDLARAGIGSIVLDRGKQVQPRRRDLKKLNQGGSVDADSNYCFGEGGAGTYSDGKLYTRATKRGDVRDVLEILALHGAPENILTDARPHIGSNRLPKVITALRERLESVGVAFHFEKRVTELLAESACGARRVTGVRCLDGTEFTARSVVIATGHSARDMFEILERAGAKLEAKPFALGVRVEHPQELINRIQFGRAAGHPKLGSAAYRLTTEVASRSVFSFCMCPGGFVVPAATEAGGVVVNGMSLAKRDSRYANSGIVVALRPEDVSVGSAKDGAFWGVELQRTVEERAFEAGGGALRAPAVRLTDFLARRASSSLPKGSYIPGLSAANLDDVFDPVVKPVGEAAPCFSDILRGAFKDFERQMRGMITEEAVIIGVETRTSSPVRVVRDPVSLESIGLLGLYPAGEGAGFAGGIVSAALDGIRVARVIGARSS